MCEGGLLKGRYALVTGASRGIGSAVTRTFAEQGCNIIIVSRNSSECTALANEIAKKHAVCALGIGADVADQSSVHRLFREVQRWSDCRLDILVNNAGYPLLPEIWNTPLHATPTDKIRGWYQDILQTDTMGALFCTFEALHLMMAMKKGSIVFISSTSALEGYQGTPYTIAKAAVLGLMKDVASAYGKHNIRANALALGGIQTPATFNSLDWAARKKLSEKASMNRWGTPDEVGRAALFLASDLSSYVNGQTLVVDGGALRH